MYCCDNENKQLSVEEMRVLLRAFQDTQKYPENVLSISLTLAQQYIHPQDCCLLKGLSRRLAIYYMAAHVQTLQDQAVSGNLSNGVPTSASIDRVSVSVAPPPYKDQYEYWLNQTPYGAMYLALLNSVTGLGVYVGGSNENVFMSGK